MVLHRSDTNRRRKSEREKKIIEELFSNTHTQWVRNENTKLKYTHAAATHLCMSWKKGKFSHCIIIFTEHLTECIVCTYWEHLAFKHTKTLSVTCTPHVCLHTMHEALTVPNYQNQAELHCRMWTNAYMFCTGMHWATFKTAEWYIAFHCVRSKNSWAACISHNQDNPNNFHSTHTIFELCAMRVKS